MASQKPSRDGASFRPRMGGKKGNVRVQRVPGFIPSVLARVRGRFVRAAGLAPARPGRRHIPRGVADVARPGAGARRCIVKARIVRMGAHGVKTARLHLSYIERDGVDRDGSPGSLYGPDDTFERASLSESIRGERHQFRFIVSPEDGIDLTAFTRDLMSRVESDLGVRLRWGGVNHYDTDNPHAHVVVRGVDQGGHPVHIDRLYISERMRWRAQSLLTDELGPRLTHEVDRQLDREVRQERLTSIDRKLGSMLEPAHTIGLARIAGACRGEQRKRVIGRLQTLENLQLATRTAPGVWALTPGWQEALRDLSERDDICKRMYRATKGDTALEHYEIVDGRTEHEEIVGVVRRKGLHDELRGQFYAVVETARGGTAYICVDDATARGLKEGTIACVTVERQTWAKPIDRVLAQVAGENGGVYDAQVHLAQMRRRPVVIAGRTLQPEEVVAVNLRRLQRLERHRLVSRLADGRWRVPADLVQVLRARDVSHPRRLVRARQVAPSLRRQVTLHAPCWLDTHDPATPRAPFGLGVELGAAIDARARFLTGLGVPLAPPDERARALERLERFDIARKLGAEHGLTPLPAPLPGMRGTLLACGQSAAGAPLVCVLDQSRRHVAVIPMPADARPLVGRVVTIRRDTAGRLLIQPDGLGKGL